MTDLEMAKVDPSSLYKRPAEVIKDTSLTRKQKIDVLMRWAYDEREMAVAEEENMTILGRPDDSNLLDEILHCLIELGADRDQNRPPPTKQG